MYCTLFCLITGLSLLAVTFDQISYADEDQKNEIKNVLPRDAIPAIKRPEFVPASDARLDYNEPVLGLIVNGECRAYSVYLLNHHEIVNDKIGDKAFAVTWCPLANLAVVYDRVIDGKEYTFGVSGSLLKNTLVMFDYETESLWPIIYGEAVQGELAGRKLRALPACQKVSWGAWRKLHPNTIVLSYRGSRTVGYDAYKNYHKNSDAGVHPPKNIDKRLNEKTNIIGIEVNDRYKAYPFYLFNDSAIQSDGFQGLNLLVYRNKDTGTIMVYDRMIDGVVVDFEKSKDYATDKITGTTWDLESGIGLSGNMKGKKLRHIKFSALYWFVWADYFPKTDLFEVE